MNAPFQAGTPEKADCSPVGTQKVYPQSAKAAAPRARIADLCVFASSRQGLLLSTKRSTHFHESARSLPGPRILLPFGNAHRPGRREYGGDE